MQKKSSRTATSTWRKISAGLLRIFLFLVLLETGLRLGGFVLFSVREYGNLQSIKQKGAYRILCLGESTTQGQYPYLLEQFLNQRNIGVRFNVIDKGRGVSNTIFILSRVESYLAEYRPDMVVAMMGNNDKGVRYFQDISEADTWIFRHCQIYRFVRILSMYILKKIKLEDIDGFNKVDSKRKAKPEDAETVAKKINLSKERSADKVEKLNFKGAGGNPGPKSSYLEGGKLSSAEEVLGKDVEHNPQNDKDYVGLGRLYLEQGKFPQAEGFCKRALELNPKNDRAYGVLGWLYQKQGKFSQAEDSFKKAIEINPENAKACAGLGLVYQIQGKFFQAVDSFKKAIELNPKDDQAYVRLGQLYLKQDKFSPAEELFKKAIELNPQDDHAHVGLGRLYLHQGKFLQAEDSFRKAVELNPEKGKNRILLGRIYRVRGKLPQAEESFKKSIELMPGDYHAYAEFGELYRMEGKFPQAEEMFKKAIELDPKNDRTVKGLLSLYEEMGKPELAKEYIGKADESEQYALITVHNYRKLKEILDRKGIKLVCVQYPVRNVAPLKRIFENDKGVIFVDNERVFKEALKKGSYREYFNDMLGGDFGHCTQKGNMLLAQNIADAILREVFNRR